MNKQEDITRCFEFYPEFREDFSFLLERGTIKRIAYNNYEWTEEDASLAQYFKSIKLCNERIPGGFWEPIAKVFGKNKRNLSKLANKYHNKIPSKNFKELKTFLIQCRKTSLLFNNIKKFIDEAEGECVDNKKTAIDKIKKIINR
ncbi:MAG: hypothetical protein FWG77_10790 [Treponema sp.]|nr:hypothetical protein [Treponema sp.]